MIKKIQPKSIILFSAFAAITILSVAILLAPDKNQESFAQSPKFIKFFCQEPIPIGEANQEALNILDDLYQQYIQTRNTLDLALREIQAEIADLYRDPENEGPCDFSVCKPFLIDRASDFSLKIGVPMLGSRKIGGIHIPICSPYPCIGEPCADLSSYLDKIKTLQSAVSSSLAVVNDILTKPSVVATNEIRRKDTEAIGTLITRPESVLRKVRLTREWLHPGPTEGKRSCVMSPLERQKAEAGEISYRFPMRCADAVKEGYYWPKPWSEYCKEQCKEGPTKGCKECLAHQFDGLDQTTIKASSALAKINYVIYGKCAGHCSENLTQECLDCIKEKEDISSEEELINFLCGDNPGSYYNWTCCSETILEEEGGGETTVCSPEKLKEEAKKYGYPEDYTPHRSEELQEFLDCIEAKVKEATKDMVPGGYDMPKEGESNEFYGSVFTWDHDYYPCNFTRGRPVCSSKCSHSINSCHYGGATGVGAMAVDFGTDFINHQEVIIRAAYECAQEQGKSLDGKILVEGDHLHISLPDCSITSP